MYVALTADYQLQANFNAFSPSPYSHNTSHTITLSLHNNHLRQVEFHDSQFAANIRVKYQVNQNKYVEDK